MGKAFLGPRNNNVLTVDDLEISIAPYQTRTVYVDREIFVPQEVIKIEERVVEVIKEVFITQLVDKIIEKPVPYEVIKEIQVFVPQEKIVFQEKIIEIEKFISKEIAPKWLITLAAMEALLIMGLLFK